MEALFFLSRRAGATGVTSCDDLPSEPVADALRLSDPSPLTALADFLGVEHTARPLRDATCRSFPVWDLGGDLTRRLAALSEDEIEAAAEQWHKHSATSLEADLYELMSCLTDLCAASGRREEGETLFALLEERAF